MKQKKQIAKVKPRLENKTKKSTFLREKRSHQV